MTLESDDPTAVLLIHVIEDRGFPRHQAGPVLGLAAPTRGSIVLS
jgi:hypothetical protein